MFRKRAFLGALAGLFSTGAFAAGTVVVCGDEWTLSDSAFTGANSAFTKVFASNAANFLAGAGGTILDLSNNAIHSGVQLDTHLTGQGFTVDQDGSSAITLGLLSGYNAVIAGGIRGSSALAALTAYVSGGGNVYVYGGTGEHGSAPAEAGAWNPFTTLYGITMGPTYIAPPASVDVTTDPGFHPLRSGVDMLTFGFGHDLTVSGGSVVAISGGPELSAPTNMVATNAVPEPATIAALSLGLLALRRRKA